MKKVNIGIVITARDTFPPRENAMVNANKIQLRLKEILGSIPQVECIYAEHLLEDGMMTSTCEAQAVADYFAEKKVDALFVPHANFGQEEAVGIVANALRIPTLIWGPRDGSPIEGEPFRETDTQCGLFATTRLLLRYGVTYTYLRNCWIDSRELETGIKRFIRVASVVKAYKNLRVLQISTRPWQFLSVKINESELLERFGIHVVPVESTEILSEINRFKQQGTEVEKQLKVWEEQNIKITGMGQTEKEYMASIVLAISELAKKYQCSTVASECWKLLRTNYGIAPCFAFGYLSQMGLPVACENDIHGAISAILAQAASLYETPSFLADITVRHPHNDNAELLWHCGPFPPALSKGKAIVDEGKGQYPLKDGKVTLVRFEADHQKYVLLAEEAETTDGPKTTGNYIWIQTKDWGKWEDKLMYGPYIHHIAGVYGEYKDVLKEACRYMGLVHDFVY